MARLLWRGYLVAGLLALLLLALGWCDTIRHP